MHSSAKRIKLKIERIGPFDNSKSRITRSGWVIVIIIPLKRSVTDELPGNERILRFMLYRRLVKNQGNL